MRNFRKPGSRLILLFIGMLVVSGAMLTILGISNIANLKLLIEKKITEEEQQLASRYSQLFQDQLVEMALDFEKNLPEKFPADSTAYTRINKPDTLFYPFILSSENDFLFPYYVEKGKPVQWSGPAARDFQTGEKAEFRQNNPKAALLLYRSGLEKARTSEDSALLLNALGRVAFKTGQFNQAEKWYRENLYNHPGEINSGGFPYACFSISQLLKIPDFSDSVRLDNILFFLENLNKGIIPLFPGTALILEEIGNQMHNGIYSSPEESEKINREIARVREQIGFINTYGKQIQELAGRSDGIGIPGLAGRFEAFPVSHAGNNRLFLIDRNRTIPAGLAISPEILWKQIKTGDSGKTGERYLAELVPDYQTNPVIADKLTWKTELSSLFPSYRLWIKPRNPDVVKEAVRLRSWTYGIALVLLLGGLSLGIVLILRDIGREKKLAATQSEFVSHVTHELKTPLTSISMFAETIFLDRAKTPEARKKYSRIIMKESEVLKRKIDNILEYAVRKNEKSKYKIRENDLSALVDEVMEEMQYWLDINHFEVKVEKEGPVMALVDADAIKQTLSNLVGNAIKYSFDRKQLTVRLFRKEGKVFLEVEDKGIGIPKDQAELIFEKFYRVQSRENESTTGTGLGLSVTRDIVLAHGGEIKVQSRPGEGSLFTVILNSI